LAIHGVLIGTEDDDVVCIPNRSNGLRLGLPQAADNFGRRAAEVRILAQALHSWNASCQENARHTNNREELNEGEPRTTFKTPYTRLGGVATFEKVVRGEARPAHT
jgi:hypothetical protein